MECDGRGGRREGGQREDRGGREDRGREGGQREGGREGGEAGGGGRILSFFLTVSFCWWRPRECALFVRIDYIIRLHMTLTNHVGIEHGD